MGANAIAELSAAAIGGRLADSGFQRHGGRNLWVRRMSASGIVHAIGISTRGPGAERRLACGVWVRSLAGILERSLEPRLEDLTDCHARFDDCGPLTPGGVQICLALLDRFRSLEQVDEFIESDAPRSWPGGAVAELYLAGLAVLSGHPATLQRVTRAATHLEGAGALSQAANHLYAMVATGE